MMRPPDCPDHGRLALDLALGRLAIDPDAAADRAVADCPHCRAWWRERLEDGPAAALDPVIESALAVWAPPRRRWPLRVAAAAALVAAATTTWIAVRPAPDPRTPGPGELVRSLFVTPTTASADVNGDGQLDASDLVAAVRAATVRD